MRYPRRAPLVLWLGSFLLCPPLVSAADMKAAVKERVYQITEFFDTQLPGTLEAHNLALHFTPKFSDMRDQEYIRYPVELRYGLQERLELTAGLVPFGPNPFNTGRDHRWGPGEAKFAVRYALPAPLPYFTETTIGVETRVPIGKPPTELNDHYTHVKPFVSVARSFQRWPSTTFYTNLSYDRSVRLTERGRPPPDVIRRNVIDVWPGFLFRPSELGYFAEYRFSHISEDLDWRLAHEVRFGSIWDVPLERTRKWRLPGKWQAELAYKIGHEEGRDTDQGIFVRVSWRTSLREVLNHASALKEKTLANAAAGSP
jgi:hypothetical protein